MHDINYIRNNPIEFDNAIKKRGENNRKIKEKREKLCIIKIDL